MKKTEKTALTAALFAAALNFVPTGASAANDDPVRTAREEMAGVYGPPPQYTDTTEPTETTEPNFDDIQFAYGPPAFGITTEPVTSATTEPTMVPLYGPPPVFNTNNGDIDGDGKVTAFDMVLMRKKFLEHDFDSYEDELSHDLNGDGYFGVADMVMLQRYLLGRINGFSEEDSISEEEAMIEATTTGMAMMYGPPWVFDPSLTTAADDDVVTEVSTNFTAVYMAPVVKTTTTTTAVEEPYDPITTTREVMADVYGPPAWYGHDEE